MAFTDQNIVITPNIGSSSDTPKIVFSGANASTTAQNITLRAYPQNSGTLSFEGSTGQLFSVANTMSGTIFSVNDVSGIPSIEVLDTGLVKVAQYSGNVLLGTGTDNGTDKLQVNGSICATGIKTSGSFCSAGICSTGAVLAATCVCAGTCVQAAGAICAGGLICASGGNITTACCLCAGGCVVSPQAYLGCICTQSGGIISCTYVCSLTGNICSACCITSVGMMCASGCVIGAYVYPQNWGCAVSGWCTGGIVCAGNCIMGNVVCGVIGICSSCCICAANYVSAGTCIISPVVCASTEARTQTLQVATYCCGGGICMNWANTGYMNMFMASGNVLCLCGSGASGCGVGICAGCFISAPVICGTISGCATCAYCACCALYALCSVPGVNFNVNCCVIASGTICSGGLIIASQSGFQSATYASGRNRMWSFANADAYGMSYWQGAGGYSSGVDMIGMHFGNAGCAAASQFQFVQDGRLYASGLICSGSQINTAGMVCAGTCILGNSYLCVPNCVIAGGTLCGGSVYSSGCIQGTCLMASAMVCSATCIYGPCHYSSGPMCAATHLCAGCCVYAGAYSCAGTCMISPIICGITAVCSPVFYGCHCGCSSCSYCACCALYAYCSVPGANFYVNCCILATGGICTNSMMCAASSIQSGNGVYGTFLCSCGRVCIIAQTAVNCLCCASFGAIEIAETSPANSGCWFIPGYHQVSTLAGYGYRQHLTIGQYRPANGAWGAAFIGVGGNDSYPTVFWCFDYGGNMCTPGNNCAGGCFLAAYQMCAGGMICSASCLYSPYVCGTNYVMGGCGYFTTCACTNGGFIAAGYICSYACLCALNMINTNGCVIAGGYLYTSNWLCAGAGVCSPGMICSASCLYAPCHYASSVICSAGYICAGCCIYAGAYSCAGICLIAPIVCGITAICSANFYGMHNGCATCAYCSCCALYACCSVPGANFNVNCCIISVGSVVTNVSGNASGAMTNGLSLWTDGGGTTSWQGFKCGSTVGWGTHGSIPSSEYATYFIMDTTARGWIYRDASRGVNHTSISNCGVLCTSCCVSSPIVCAVTSVCACNICVQGGWLSTSPYGICTYGVGGNSNAPTGQSYNWGYQQAGTWACGNNCGEAYPDLILGYHTGVKIGGYWGYGGTRFYSNHPDDSGTMIFSVGCYDCNIRATNAFCAGSTICSGANFQTGSVALYGNQVSAGNLHICSCGYYTCIGTLNSSWAHMNTNASSGFYFYTNVCLGGTALSANWLCGNCCVYAPYVCGGACVISPYVCGYNYVMGCCGYFTTCACTNGGFIAAGYICSYACLCALNMINTNGCVIAGGYLYTSNWLCAGAGVCSPGMICSSACLVSPCTVISCCARHCGPTLLWANWNTGQAYSGGQCTYCPYTGGGRGHRGWPCGFDGYSNIIGAGMGNNQYSGNQPGGYPGVVVCGGCDANNYVAGGGAAIVAFGGAGSYHASGGAGIYACGGINGGWGGPNQTSGGLDCGFANAWAVYGDGPVYSKCVMCVNGCLSLPGVTLHGGNTNLYMCSAGYWYCFGPLNSTWVYNNTNVTAGHYYYNCICSAQSISALYLCAGCCVYAGAYSCAGTCMISPYICGINYVMGNCGYFTGCICTNGGFIAAGYLCGYSCICGANMIRSSGCVIADGYLYTSNWLCAGAGVCSPGMICSSACLVSPCSVITCCARHCGPTLLWANWNTGQAYAPNCCTYCPYTGGGRGHSGWAYGYNGYSNIIGAGMGNSAYGGYPGGYPGLVVCGGCDANNYTAGGGAGIVTFGGSGSYHASGGAGIYAKGGCNGVWGGPNQSSGGLDAGCYWAWAVYGDGPTFGTMVCAGECFKSPVLYTTSCICTNGSFIAAGYICAYGCICGLNMISSNGCGVFGGYLYTSNWLCAGSGVCTPGYMYSGGCIIAGGYLYASGWLCTAGGVCTAGNVVAYNTSDCRLKKCIVPITCALMKIEQMSGVEFTWNDDVVAKEMENGCRSYFKANDIGVIAQEVERVLPQAVVDRNDGFKGVNYEKIVPLLIQAIKEQQKDIAEIREMVRTSKFN